METLDFNKMDVLRRITTGWIEILYNFNSWSYMFESSIQYAENNWWNLTSFSSEPDWEEHDALYEKYVGEY